MNIEWWKYIIGYEGLYQVSNLGRVKNVVTDRILKPQKGTKGYLLVKLYKNKTGKTFKIHRLVAQAFIPNPNNLPDVNHKDERPQNNCVSNLEWCTPFYNNHYGTHYKNTSKSLTNHPQKSKSIEQYTLDGIFISEYPSVSEAQRQVGISTSQICRCCLGKYQTAGGYIWKYSDNQ